MTDKIITICRQSGSGGLTIGKTVAKELGIKCYHNEIIRRIAEETGFDKGYIHGKGEKSLTGNHFLDSINKANEFISPLPEEEIWIQQQKIMREIAKEGPAVFVGRCADYILQDFPNQLNVYVYADIEDRTKRIVEKYKMNLNNSDSLKAVRIKDKQRKMFYEYNTDRKFGDTENYDICLNSSRISMRQCVDIILSLC